MNCQTGLGFCDFQWFPGFQKKTSAADKKAITVKEQMNSDNSYFEIYFASEIPQELSDEDLNLIVEEDLLTISDKGDTYTIKGGEYYLDRCLGEFGGYKVVIK